MAGKPGFPVSKLYRFRYKLGMSITQIALRMGLHYTTVRYHLNKVTEEEALRALEEV